MATNHNTSTSSGRQPQSAVLEPDVLVGPEKLADYHDDGHARRSWGIELYVEGMVSRYERAVDRVLANHPRTLQQIACTEAARELDKKQPLSITLLRKVGGRPDVRPHNCINELSRDLECEVCGAVFEACNHENVVCDKAAQVYRCTDCGTVTGHFVKFAAPGEYAVPENHAVIGNGLYARTRGGR